MTDVIRRKIDRARVPLADGAPGADRCWRLALARAARDAAGLDLEARSLGIIRASLTEIIDTAPDRALVAVLDGPKGGLGVLLLSPEVTSSLIEMQTLARLAPQPPAARKPTRIDAAMVAGVIDRALAGLEDALAEEADLVWAGGFRYASFLEELRSLTLMLEEEVYRVLRAGVDLHARAPLRQAAGDAGSGVPANATRTGEVILIVPATGRGPRPAALATPEDALAPQFRQALSAQVMQAGSRLEAVVGRLSLPLARVIALQPGEVLALPVASLDAIVVETPDGRPVASGRLGQNRGMRAIKLAELGHQRETATGLAERRAPAQASAPGTALAPPQTEPDLRVAS